MEGWSSIFTDAVIILILLGGIYFFRRPEGARWGNRAAMLALALAIVAVIARNGLERPLAVTMALLVGAVVGLIVALRVNMTQIPAMVALQHGAGGMAALLISMLEVWRGSETGLALFQVVAGLVGMIVGAATFSGSLVAAGKLSGLLRGAPRVLPRHSLLTASLFLAAAILAALSGLLEGGGLLVALLLSVAFAATGGLVLSIRIGGADMPVLISFLNATAGFAAAFCGVIIENRLLVVCGAVVAASGSVLTAVMCKAMNRSLVSLFVAPRPSASAVQVMGTPVTPSDALLAPAAESPVGPAGGRDPFAESLAACREASRVIIIPGYGMARSQAQFEVVALSRYLAAMGKDVRFAIHPVAGRMPGHMHVLLAEADVSYDKLFELKEINPEFENTDLAIVVGACDVVNPAALCVDGCPISGMPILLANEARQVVVCNVDDKPGYSGVENPLYESRSTIMLLGDAKETIAGILAGLSQEAAAA